MRAIESNRAILIKPRATIRDALKQIDLNSEGMLFVIDDEMKLIGSLTDGDIRRALIAGSNLTDSITGTYNKNPFFFYRSKYNIDTAKTTVVENRFEVVPIVDDQGRVTGYITWDDLLSGVEREPESKAIDVPVVIMAGGKGTRMAPFTNVLPKPLVPVGDKTILELIIDSFRKHSVQNYFFTINYRGEMIKAYFDCIEKDYKVTYLKETDFWGTAGSLTLLPDDFPETFIVSNCDIIVRADFADVIEFHKNSKSDLTVLSSIQHHQVPYGVIKFESGGIVTAIEEKPEFSFCINTGVYILQKSCLDFIPKNEMFHMTHLIERLMSNGRKVFTYPINESEYIDVGQWDEYNKAVKQIGGF